MNDDQLIARCKAHSFYSWAAQRDVAPIPLAGGKGAWFWTAEGKRYLDFNSMTMSVNAGHGQTAIADAIARQAHELACAMPHAATAVRARVGELLDAVTPDGLSTFFFTLGGAEANENAVKAARWFTGRSKIVARYRSYHGATAGAMQLTGDPRRWKTEPGPPGVIHVLDPDPYGYRFGRTDAERTEAHLRYLEETLMYEGPDTIAAMIIETVTGTNGVLIPPDGWLAGLKALLDRHGILLIADEVMAGFGRTGRWFAFEHWGVVPDIVTMAKGVTSGYAPLGVMAVSDRLRAYFEDAVFLSGLTGHGHPIPLAAAEANIRLLRDAGMVENAARLEPIMRAEIAALAERRRCVRGGRAIGLFGMIDLQRDDAGTPVSPYNVVGPEMKAFKKALLREGLYAYPRWSTVMALPPLCVTEDELREGFRRMDRALGDLEQALF